MTANPPPRSFRLSVWIGRTLCAATLGTGWTTPWGVGASLAQDSAPAPAPAAPPATQPDAAPAATPPPSNPFASSSPDAATDSATESAADAEVDGEGEGSGETRFNGLEDARGLPWGVTSNGVLGLSSGCIARGMGLSVGGKAFRSTTSTESVEPNRGRYRVEGEADGVTVVRDVMVDLERGGARYFDTFTLAGDAEAPREIEVHLVSALGGTIQGLRTSSGGQYSNALQPNDYGLVVQCDGSEGVANAFFVIAGTTESVRPTLTFAGGELGFHYKITLEPGQPRALLHWVAQRPGVVPEDPVRWFEDFYRRGRHLGAEVPADADATIANFAPGATNDDGFFAPRAESLLTLRELEQRLGCEREEEDVLWVSQDSRIRGELEGSAIRIVSETFGEVAVPLAEVAAIQGGGGRGVEHRLYLRDGHVLSGPTSSDDLRLKGREGWSIDIDIARLEALLLRLRRDDGAVLGEGHVAVALHSGDVVVGAPDPAVRLALLTPWGHLKLPVADLRFAAYTKLPSPRYRVLLHDGSRLSAFVSGGEVVVRSPRLGEVRFPDSRLDRWWPADAEEPAAAFGSLEEAEDILEFDDLTGPLPTDRSLFLLDGGNVVAAEIAMPSLTLMSGVAATSIAPAEIVTLQRSEDDGGSEIFPRFALELAGGDTLHGPLKEAVIRLRSSHGEWDVPVQHLLSYRSSNVR